MFWCFIHFDKLVSILTSLAEWLLRMDDFLFLHKGDDIFCNGWSSIVCVIVEDSVGISVFLFLLFEADIICIGCDSGTCSSGFLFFQCEILFVSFWLFSDDKCLWCEFFSFLFTLLVEYSNRDSIATSSEATDLLILCPLLCTCFWDCDSEDTFWRMS